MIRSAIILIISLFLLPSHAFADTPGPPSDLRIGSGASTYTLTVTSGSGDGDYQAGQIVQISAYDPDEGTAFAGWSGDVEYVEDEGSASTSLSMPEGDVEVVAEYRDEEILAFPGAKGFGSTTPGGRGGEVIKVINLNNDGPGSLREAVSASGPRIVVFDIGGTIVLDSDIVIKNPYITIAGQTAPGDGITLRRANITVFETHDVIMRGLRFRIGNEDGGPPLDNRDAFQISGTASNYNIVIDHCSFSWSTDEILTTWGGDNYNITISNCIFTEPLNYDGHGYGVMFGPGSSNITFHNNIIAHSKSRLPRISGWVSGLPDRLPATSIELYNNIMYNWVYEASLVGSDDIDDSTHPLQMHWINNYFIPGPDWTNDKPPIKIHPEVENNAIPELYCVGNIGPGRANNTEPEENIVRVDGREYVATSKVFASSFAPSGNYTTVYDELLGIEGEGIGAYYPSRDSVDERTISDILNRTGNLLDTQEHVGGWPNLQEGTPPVDTDGDGMPDSWETSYGLDPQDPTDANTDNNNDGYTNIEVYINSLFE